MLENAAKVPSGIGVNPHNHSSQSHAPAGTRHSPLGMPQAAAISSGVGMARQPGQHLGMFVSGIVVKHGVDQLAGRDLALDGIEAAADLSRALSAACC